MTHKVPILLGCARCGQDHANLEFKQFAQPIDLIDKDGDGPYNYWTPCPTNGDPILLVITDKPCTSRSPS